MDTLHKEQDFAVWYPKSNGNEVQRDNNDAIFIGGVTSDLFVPLFQSIFDASQSVPPFAVIPERSDYLKLYAVIGVMLLTAFVVLGRLIKKIKISQALKLGED